MHDPAFCSVETRKSRQDLIASIEYRPHHLLVEFPEPWEHTYSLSPHYPEKLAVTLQSLAKKQHVVTVNGFAPDSVYSQKDRTRVFYLRALSSSYQKLEFLFPSQNLADRVEKLVLSNDPGSEFEEFKVDELGSRDYFICAHFNRDRCCGIFGRALYEKMREAEFLKNSGLRLFKCTHIGGHRFAPTMFEIPSMTFWGYLDETSMRNIMSRENISSAVDHYRGGSGLMSPYFQVAEREVLRRVGWDWFHYEHRTFTGSFHEKSATITVRLQKNPQTPENVLTVEIDAIEPSLMLANCADLSPQPFPQYRVKKVVCKA